MTRNRQFVPFAAILFVCASASALQAQERFLILDHDFQVTCIAHETGDVVFGEVTEAGVVKSVRWSESDGRIVIADGANHTHVLACNADGTVAVGYFIEAGINRPFRWTSATGIQELAATGTDGGEARDCSADGSIVVGTFRMPPPGFGIPRQRAFQWSESAGATLIPILPGGTDQNAATSCSDTGVAFGWSQSTSGIRAFRYSAVEGLSNLAAIGDAPRANAELTLGSADGTAAAVNEAAFGVRPRTAIWRQVAGYQNLPLLSTDFNANTLATCTSANGNLVAGEASVQGTASLHAFRWSPTSGMVDMGTLGGASSRATAVTGDGEHVYGIADTAVGSEAFVWEFTGGMRTLKSHAQKRLPGDTAISDWRFGEMVVSRDGRRMFVEGTRTDNLTRVLFFDLEPPANTPPEISPISPVVLESSGQLHAIELSTIVNDIDGQAMTVRWKVNGTVRKTQSGVAPGTQVIFLSSYSYGVHNVSVEAADGFDTTSAGTTVTIQDTIAPTIIVAPDVVVPTDAGKNFSTKPLTPPVAQDSSGHPVQLSSDAPAKFPLGLTTVTWTGRDIGGNEAKGTQRVTVEDREAPTIVGPTNVRVFCDRGKLFATFAFVTPNVVDNVSANVTVTNDAKTSYPIGSTKVTWTATDEVGNQAKLSAVVTVVNRAPKANAGRDLTITTTSERGVRVLLNGSSSSDPDGHALKFKWSVAGVRLQAATGKKPAGVFPVGVKTVKLTVTDAGGLKHTDTMKVTVKLKNARPRSQGRDANRSFELAAQQAGGGVASGARSEAALQGLSYAQTASAYGDAAGDFVRWEEGQSEEDAAMAYAELRAIQRQYGEAAASSLLSAFAETGDESLLAAYGYAVYGAAYAAADLAER